MLHVRGPMAVFFVFVYCFKICICCLIQADRDKCCVGVDRWVGGELMKITYYCIYIDCLSYD